MKLTYFPFYTECMIMGNECRRNCDMRDKATRGIFKHNCYTYGKLAAYAMFTTWNIFY